MNEYSEEMEERPLSHSSSSSDYLADSVSDCPFEHELGSVQLSDYLASIESVYGRLLVDVAQKCMKFDAEERCRSSYELVKKFERFDQSIAEWCKYQKGQLFADRFSQSTSKPNSRASSVNS